MSELRPVGGLVEYLIGGGWGDEQPTDESVAVSVIRGADFPAISHGDVSTLPKRYETRKRVDARRLQDGDIVLEISGGTKDRPTGRTVYVSQRLLNNAHATLIPASFCRLVRPNRSLIEPRYLYYWLQEMYVAGRTWSYQVQSTGLANFQIQTFLERERVWLPPLNVQRRIVDVLGSLDDLIAMNYRISVDLEHLLAAKFALYGFDQPSNDAHRLADLISINPPYGKPRTDAPYIDMSALPTDHARVASVVQRAPSGGARFRNGDTVMARITPCLENGKTAYIDLLGPDEIGIGSTEFIVLRSSGMLGHHWSYFLARSPRFREYAVQHMSGTSGRQRCPADAIARYPIAPPDRTAASSFAKLAEVLFEAIRKIDDEAHQAARARDELLPLLLSGQVQVEDVAA